MTHKLDSGIHDLAVCKYMYVVTFALFITYTYWTLVDAQAKTDRHSENQKCYLHPK